MLSGMNLTALTEIPSITQLNLDLNIEITDFISWRDVGVKK